ncbi:metal-sulfur cluster assembly factor [Thermus scotoductus]|uniref:metal-sulfur cluster assembly factor n=1 Tax=Thermus scotoductus TaxID=37636 RepID=UPI00036B0FE7|nr:metal-sulfur cluster assembly factor [Thermus scotoductus]
MDERHREGLPEGQAGLQEGNANQAGGKEGLPTKEQVLEALKVVYDPEIPVNIVDLGLVYDVEIHENGVVDLTMTLTAIGCPAQDMVKADAEMAVMRLPIWHPSAPPPRGPWGLPGPPGGAFRGRGHGLGGHVGQR